jgi:hypothetical protein
MKLSRSCLLMRTPIVSVVWFQPDKTPTRCGVYDGENGPMKHVLDVEGISEPYNAPRQILPPVYWQTGHIDAIRVSTIAGKQSLTGDVVYPLLIDPRYTVDIDTLSDWAKYEALVYSGLEMVIRRRQFEADHAGDHQTACAVISTAWSATTWSGPTRMGARWWPPAAATACSFNRCVKQGLRQSSCRRRPIPSWRRARKKWA